MADRVDRIKNVWQAHNRTNTFYFCFENAESALAQSKTNNIDILADKLISSIQDVRNFADEENDYIPECDSKIFVSPDPKLEIDNLVIAEEGHSPLNIYLTIQTRVLENLPFPLRTL